MTLIKICGHKSVESAEKAIELGADMIGVITKVKVPTPREVSLEKASHILEYFSNEKKVETVIVTMPEDGSEIINYSEKLDPDHFQIHSDLNISELKKIRKKTKKSLINVIKLSKKEKNAHKVINRAYKVENVSDFILLDTEGNGGGTGITHNWKISRKIVDRINTKVILGGGLIPSNVKRAIKAVNPDGVDVASGVESKPGKKDKKLMSQFVKNVRGLK